MYSFKNTVTNEDPDLYNGHHEVFKGICFGPPENYSREYSWLENQLISACNLG